MLMATPLGQTVTAQEVSVALRARGYYPLPVSPPPPVSPPLYQLQIEPIRPPVRVEPEIPQANGGWLRYMEILTQKAKEEGWYPALSPPVSPPVVHFEQIDLPVSPSIYEEFITRSVQPTVRHVAEEITIERPEPVFRRVEEEITIPPPISPEYVPALSPPLDVPPLFPEPSYSPPPEFIIQEFPDGLPGLEPLPEWEVIPDELLPVSPIPGVPPPEEKKGVWVIIAVLGAAMLLAGEEKKPERKRLEDRRLELRRKEQWT